MDCNGTENQLWSGYIYKEPLVKGNSLADLKNALVRLEALEENAGRADEEYEAAPEDAEKEKAFDTAYQAEYNAFMAVAEMIVKMTGGQIDIKTARIMIRTKRNEILNLVA